MSSILLLGLMLAAPQASPIPTAPPAPSAVAPAAGVDRLMAILLPEDRLVAMNLDEWRPLLKERFADDAEVQRREQAQPGFAAAVEAATLRDIETAYRSELPAMRRDLTAVYRDNLTPGEIGELIAFLSTPTGAKMAAQVQAGVARSNRVTPDGMRADGMQRALGSFTAEDVPALRKFGQTSVARKAKEVTPKVAEISNRSIVAITDKVEAVLPQARQRMLNQSAR